MDRAQKNEFIAKRVARELKRGDVVNLGIGMPTMVANYVADGLNVIFQSENGFLGLGPAPLQGQEDSKIVNAGAQCVTILPGGVFFDSAASFGIIRGGHVDITVLGALQVAENGDLANWMIPGKMVPGMGGAMDLVTGAKKVIVAMEHTVKGEHKILKKCNLPLTAAGEVDMIVTEMGVIKVSDRGLILTEINSKFTVDQVQDATEARLIISDNLIEIEI